MKYYLTRGTIGATDLEIDENDYENHKNLDYQIITIDYT